MKKFTVCCIAIIPLLFIVDCVIKAQNEFAIREQTSYTDKIIHERRLIIPENKRTGNSTYLRVPWDTFRPSVSQHLSNLLPSEIRERYTFKVRSTNQLIDYSSRYKQPETLTGSVRTAWVKNYGSGLAPADDEAVDVAVDDS